MTESKTHDAGPRKGIFLLPNLLTTGGLFSGFYAIVASMNGHFEAAAVAIFNALKQRLGDSIELHIVGRLGWGPDASLLQNTAGVFCRGYLSGEEIKTLLDSATFYLSTSHDEGLGLPLLELQYSGIAVVAAKIPVFAEVLGESGLLVDVSDAEQAAAQIINFLSDPAQAQRQSELARQNIQRWNALAAADKQAASVLFRE